MSRFSVIIPLYNKSNDIQSTIESVLDQDFSDFEIVVVNDGSTDDSEAKVKAISDDRIKLFSKENQGVALTRNFGVEKATADYITFLDADDLWYPNHLKDLDTLTRSHPQTKWFATAYEKRFNSKLSVPLDAPVMKQSNWYGIVDNYFENCLVDSIAWTSAMCFKKEFFLELNGFDHNITNGAGEDTDLWIRAALAAPMGFCTNISAVYNLEGSNRISLTPTLHRVFMDPDNYEEAAKKDIYLKKYLDRNRYSFAMQHKLVGDKESCKRFLHKIDYDNITAKQRLLLKLPNVFLKILIWVQERFASGGIRLTSFR
ncbi:MAG: glycosyltransferase family 2 protein [Bacteroidia bacterium]|nr:glycosyltransferase family 2 protein [Bacteroidia bacterium]NNF32279.1 glycosyltransferase family 2 protein [Flavobacteriaceae bacterium]MBT8276921.1 glycosyltransferase family 2 protein [Bacteroidia bacterium]NNJ83298.1 glycosyltransferase family 2 protein [Flavobacteriaceae bacterium]NNK53762.1 glycosyltransferase family 2 protein [Flavobacteriaceae bacterium]